MTPAPLQLAHAPSELALNSAGFTPLALANAVRIGSSSPVYVAGLLRRDPRIAPWSIETTPAPAGIDPCTSELLPEPARPARSSRGRPVMVLLARSPGTVPSKQTAPPRVPAPGPRSTTWSAIAIVCG